MPWLVKAPVLGMVQLPQLQPMVRDKIQWFDLNGNMVEFSVARAWEALRPRDHEGLALASFFECPFSAKVWEYVRHLAAMEHVSPIMENILLYLQPMAHIKRSPEDIRDFIMVTVRLKLLSFRFNNNQRALVHLWHVTNVDRLVVQASLEVNVVP
ncbi:hypothetical protein Tco_0381335 [Tanacetum coccineum]